MVVAAAQIVAIGAFLAAVAGAVIFGFLVSGIDIPSRDDVNVVTALEGIGFERPFVLQAQQIGQHALQLPLDDSALGARQSATRY